VAACLTLQATFFLSSTSLALMHSFSTCLAIRTRILPTIVRSVTGCLWHELLGVDALYPTGGLGGAAPPTTFT
jgi:hypothetical protein